MENQILKKIFFLIYKYKTYIQTQSVVESCKKAVL